ncbi:MAG: nucleoside-diphosphate kinase [Candidatus Neomarinimicrobiota bacterium]|jgi:nucleoside-diphosphate kinase|nr:nucleoside-diphosphate kinase [Candidatus Neomarinimicrobiota bacterium]|tara:strand:- start:677 stop:1102 length:426 start_codon:yes stop_codon:yes gene_type:complete
MSNLTFAIIKPDAVRLGNLGKIYHKIEKSGFNIIAAKLIKLTLEQAEGFYDVHRERPFFGELTEFMSSGKCMVLALEKDNAVAEWRKTIGATNPAEAEEGTIRKEFASSIGENAVHGSDSNENAEKEISYFFTGSELRQNK